MNQTRVPSAATLGALVAVAAVGFAAWAWYHPSQYLFVRKNHTAFRTVPLYPGATFIRESTSPQYAGGSGLSRVVGYTTTREYRLQTAIPAEAVVDYYLYELRGCTVTEREQDAARFRCSDVGEVDVAVEGSAAAGRYELTVDSR